MALAASSGGSRTRVAVGQERIWLAEQAFPGSAAYHLPIQWELDGELDLRALRHTLDFLLERHEVFRTTLHQEGDSIWQLVRPPFAAPLIIHDLRTIPTSSRAERYDEYIQNFIRRPFDLTKDPLLRSLLIRQDDRYHSLVLNMHHLACDSWSLAVLRNEILECYAAFAAGRPPRLPPVCMTYSELSSLLSRSPDDAVDPASVSGLRQPDLPLDFGRPRLSSKLGDVVRVTLPLHPIARLEAEAVERGSTLFVTMLAAFGIVLESWTDEHQFAVVTPVTRRHDPRSERTVGYFADDVPIAFDLVEVETFEELATKVAAAVMEALDGVHRAGATVRGTNTVEGGVSFALDYQDRNSSAMAGLKVREQWIQPNASKYDLAMHVVRKPDSCQLELEYDADIFRQGTIQRLAHHYADLVHALGGGVRSLCDLPSASAVDVASVLRTGKGAPANTPYTGSSLPECIATIVGRSPGLIAARESGRVLDYSGLWWAASGVGQELASLGIGPEDKVGVCLSRSIELIVAIVGILRSGACFVPLDPRDPPARRAALLRKAGARALVVNNLSEDSGDWDGATLTAGLGSRGGDPAEQAELPGDRPDPDILAYVIHTSGSSGRPKGVMVSHRGLANYLGWAVKEYGLRPGVRVPLHTSIAYDMAITSLFAPLVAGGQIVLISDASDQIDQVRTNMAAFHLVKATPTNLDVLLDGIEPDSPGPAVVVVGGEKLTPEQVIRTRSVLSSVRIVNEYGPTETVVGCTASDVSIQQEDGTLVPIGRPIAGMTVRVLNRRMRLSPVGAWGDLAVGGIGVSRGYLGSPSLTATRFVPDSLTGDGARLYLTGDIGRWTPAGVLELRGRRDGQVKILGYRVEPGEIEGVLAESPCVLQAAVRIDQHPRPRIVGYVRVAGPQQLDDIWRYVRRHLPAHMVPDALVRLERMPQTTSGKLDYAALPLPQDLFINCGRRPPSTPTQRVIHDAWCVLLGVEVIDPAITFFEAGGTSLLLLKLQRSLDSAGITGLTITDLFRYPSIGELAAHVIAVEKAGGDAQPPPDASLARTDRRSARLARRDRVRKML